MNDAIIKLHPKNYKEISDKIIFYINEQKVSENNFDLIFQKLRSSKTLVVTSYKKDVAAERRYSLYIDQYVINFMGSDYLNLQCTSILSGKKAIEKKNELYRTKIFTVIPSGGVFVVYNKIIHPEVADNSWKMDQDIYNELLDCMDEYFESDEEEKVEDEKKEKIRISERFRRNIICPFRDYTDKEHWVEQYKKTQGEGVEYYKRIYTKKNDKESVYGFYTNDINADPETSFFSVGDRVTVTNNGQIEHGIYTGVIEEIDNESEDSVIFFIAFYRQLDDQDLPESGKLVMSVNDTQTKVRSRVIRSMERGKVESKYMYHVFNDFSVDGYEEVPDDLKNYLVEKMKDKYPPNQMQLEAIIKGILTKDLLLVLGPPGTGKTTVISFWVEYFIKKGKRVLISSQNNAAVDNVLARFGTMAETVRLGNENKVQENCKPYLPQNKIASMQTHFNENYCRVENEIIHNKEEIKRYKDKIQKFQDLYLLFFEKSKRIDEIINSFKKIMTNLINLYNNVCSVEKEIDSIMEARAHKEIFLQRYQTKSFIERLFRRKYAVRVKNELALSEDKLSFLRQKYVDVVTEYNDAVIGVGNAIFEFRKTGIVKEYYRVLGIVTAYTDRASLPDFIPQFMGEVAKLYHNPSYQKNLNKNLRIIKEEMLNIDQIEKAISKMEYALQDWNDMVNSDRNDVMQNALLETCQIVGATCIGINSNRDFAKVKFDVAIVDESGQIQIHNALVPMSRAEKNLLLGDYKQIPPCANDDVIAACKADEIDTKLLNMSFFEYIFESMRKKTIEQLESRGLDRSTILKPILYDYKPQPFKQFDSVTVENMIPRVTNDPKKLVNLNSQFRMPGNISDIISEWFYEGNYYSSYNMENFKPLVPMTDKPLVVISTSEAVGRIESQPSSKMGYQNVYEAQLISDIVNKVIESKAGSEKEKFLEKIEENIGIISAYGAQVRLIREFLEKKQLGIKESQIKSMVASLDSFQGQERPLILYSLTRSTTYKKPEMGRVGFMKELRRLNVAFTRCQKQLVIVGDLDYLENCMNMEKDGIWPCEDQEEAGVITQTMINQCAECSAMCERKFARFMRLLMQHVNKGAGNYLKSEEYMRRKV